MLPWPEYEAILRFHLGRLPRMFDYQKQLVRTVIAVLDAFHFNLDALEKKPSQPEAEMAASEPEPKEIEENIEAAVEKPAEDEDVPAEAAEEDLAEILEQVEEKQKQTHKSEKSKAADTIKYGNKQYQSNQY
jgi:U3 small nucleolar RNA-associated protein 20